jgi:hypothetical protein
MEEDLEHQHRVQISLRVSVDTSMIIRKIALKEEFRRLKRVGGNNTQRSNTNLLISTLQQQAAESEERLIPTAEHARWKNLQFRCLALLVAQQVATCYCDVARPENSQKGGE